MHTVELLNEAVETARRLGYEVRQDWLGGNGGGHCLVRGRKWLLLDVAQTPTKPSGHRNLPSDSMFAARRKTIA